VEQYTNSQYDDDLTIGTDEYDEYDDSFQTDDVDLFEFGGEEETTISRLKTLVLSIDWEITDEVLLQFNEEILDLKDIWADEKIQMVYLQALEKIGKYIYREKADAHPNAIRLLLSMYYNLERIVLSDELTEADKKKILLEDVRRFDKLKKVIGKEPSSAVTKLPPESMADDMVENARNELHALKAIVLGIDWEITDDDLLALREEVVRLEGVYADSKPKQVFLQGLGTIATYIRKKKSDAHTDAFSLLHSFYDGLEKLVSSPNLTLEEETEVLKPEVKKFNVFKSIIAGTLTKEPSEELDEPEDDEGPEFTGGPVAPAFADLPEEGTHGFQEEVEASALEAESPIDVEDHIEKFFGEEEPVTAEPQEESPVAAISDDLEQGAEQFSDAFFDSEAAESSASFDIDRETALQGVDVETEADDDSDEEALPVLGGEVAPALVDSDDASSFAHLETEEQPAEEDLAEEITGRLDDFFAADEESEETAVKDTPKFDVPAEVALQGVNVEMLEDEEDEEEAERFDELFASLPDEDSPAAVEGDVEVEGEVEAFFSLEEESEEPIGGEDGDQEDLFDQEMLGVREEEPLLFEPEVDEIEPIEPAAAEVAEGPVVESLPMEEEIEETIAVADTGAIEALGELRGCVRAVGTELNDDSIQGVLTEIDSLKTRWSDQPLNKSFLQLMSTVAQHLDQYRSGAGDESGALLGTLMESFEKAADEDPASAQEILFTSLGEVLSWQRDMLADLSVRGDDGSLSLAGTDMAIDQTAASFAESEEEFENVDVSDIYTLRDALKKEIAELRKAVHG